MPYIIGQKVIVTKVSGLRGRKAEIKDVIKVKGKRTIYRLKVEGFDYPFHCIAGYIKPA